MRVCIQKSTGKLLEMQSHATEGTLIANAIATGLRKDDVEEREVTPQQYEALRPPVVPPTADEMYDKAIASDRIVRAVILALNDGSMPVGANKTPAQLKAIIKAKM